MSMASSFGVKLPINQAKANVNIAQNAQSLLDDGTKKTVDTYQYKRARDLLETNSRIVESLRNSGIGGSSATFKADTFNH